MLALAYFQVEKNNQSSQLEDIFVEYCELNMHQPVKKFVDTITDQGVVGTEYRNMIDYMQKSKNEFLVLIPSAKHLGSDLESVARSLIALEELGTKTSCMDENLPDPLQNALHTLGIKGISRTRSQRIKESMRARATMGQVLGKPPYGYRIGEHGTLKVVRNEAAVIELVYRLYTKEGLGLRLITQHLNERGIKTRRGNKWNVISIRDILKNSTYTGTYTRFGVRRAKTHEAIIPPEIFRNAQDQTKSRRPIGRVIDPKPFLLSKVVYCGYCGNKMMGVTRRQSWKKKDGRRSSQIYRYYQCQSRNNLSICDYHTWRASLLEATVIAQLGYVLASKQPQPNSTDKSNTSDLNQSPDKNNDKIKTAEDRFNRAFRRAANGNTSIKTLGEYLKEVDDARAMAKRATQPEKIAETLENWGSLDLEERRNFLYNHLVRITVKDQKVKITA